MYLLGISTSLAPGLLMASTQLTPVQTFALAQLEEAELLHAIDPFETDAFRGTLLSLTNIVETETTATNAIQLSKRYDGANETGRRSLHGEIGGELSTLREIITGTDSDSTGEGTVAAEGLDRITMAGPAPGAERLFSISLAAPTAVPTPERLPAIRSHLEGHLASSKEILSRLERIVIWGKPQRTKLSTDVTALLDTTEEQIKTQGQLTQQLESLTPASAIPLSRQISAHYLLVLALEQEIARHETLGRVHLSELVNAGWALAGPALDEAPTIPGLTDFFDTAAIEPGLQERVETLLAQYIRLLRDKKGGELGPLPEQPFDLEAFATALIPSFDAIVVRTTLDFLKTGWGRKVPDTTAVATERERVTDKLAHDQAARRPLFPQHFRTEPLEEGETLRRYIGRIGIEIDEDLFRETVGVRADTAYSWGRNKRTPGNIGHVMALYRYLVEGAWRQAILYGREGEAVVLPDPMEILRLTYGEWADPFFEHAAPDDPWTIEVPIPKGVDELSYSEMILGRVLGKVWEVFELRSVVVTAGVQEALAVEDAEEEQLRAIVRTTWDAYRRAGARLHPHRRFKHTRESMRYLLGDYGDIIDFFLEAKSIIDQVATVHLPGGAELAPEMPGASHWKVRLVPEEMGLADLSGVLPRLDSESYPYKYLEGDRDHFTLLAGELAARLGFMAGVEERDSDEEIAIGSGEATHLGVLQKTLAKMQQEHARLLARLAYYRGNPQSTPFSAPQAFEQFYRRLLLFARTIRHRIAIAGNFSYQGLEIHYRVARPSAETPAITACAVTGHDSRWEVTIVPDTLVNLAQGERLDPETQRDLFRFRTVAAVLRERGVLTEADPPRLAARLFPDKEAAEHERLVSLLGSLEQLEETALEVSILDEANEDVLAIYERADRVMRQPETILPERLPRWLTERLHEFCWNRFGHPPLRIRDYERILQGYIERHSEYAQNFNSHLFEAAVSTVVGEDLATRNFFFAFFHFIGLPTSEEISQHPTTHLAVPPPDLPPATPAVSVLTGTSTVSPFPSRQGIILSDFLARQTLTGVYPETIRAVLQSFLSVSADRIRGGQPWRPEEIPTQIEQILVERARFLAVADLEPAQTREIISCAQALAHDVERMGNSLESIARSASDSLSQIVAAEFLLQMAFLPAIEDLGEITLRVLKPRVSHISPSSGAYRKGLAVADWFRGYSERVQEIQSEIEILFEIELDGHEATTEQELIDLLRERGHENGLAYLGSIQGAEDWSTFLARHEFEMTLVAPDARFAIREQWEALLAALPAPTEPEEDASAAEEEAAPTPAEERLPSRQWDPADYASFLPAEEHQAFWQRIQRLVTGEETAYLLFYVTDAGLQVARVNSQGWRDAHAIIHEPDAVGGVLGGRFYFDNLETGESEEILPIQLRYTVPIRERGHELIDWLATLTPTDPSFADMQALEAFILFLSRSRRLQESIQEALAELFPNPSRRNLRQQLNAFVAEHGHDLEIFRNYYSNLGPWGLSTASVRELSAIVGADPRQSSRYERVMDLLCYHPNLPPEITQPLREAMRELEGNTNRAGRSYLDFASTLLQVWPEALRRETERLREMLPTEGGLQALADAPELVQPSNSLLRGLRVRYEEALQAHQPADDDQRRYAEALSLIFQDRTLEPIHRILYTVAQTDPTRSPLGRMIHQTVVQNARHLGGHRRERAIRRILEFYQTHRAEFLWRLAERDPIPTWIEDALPDSMPPRHVLSAEFPELEEISYAEIDHYREYMTEMPNLPITLEGLIDRDGLWERVVVPPDAMLLQPVTYNTAPELPASLRALARDSGQGPQMETNHIPVGIRNEHGEAIFCKTLLRGFADKMEARGQRSMATAVRQMIAQLSGGQESIQLRDIFGHTITVRADEIESLDTTKGANSPAVELDVQVRELIDDPELLEVHPLLVMLFNTVRSDRLGTTNSYPRLLTLMDEIKRTRTRRPDRSRRRRRSLAPQQTPQELLIEHYRTERPHLRATLAGGRFRRYLP